MRLADPPRSSRRQALLFFVAILLPSGVLLALGLRTMGDQRRLEQVAQADERNRIVDQTREALLATLERLKLQQITLMLQRNGRIDGRPEAPVALVAALEDERLILPWENVPDARSFRNSLDEGAFAAEIDEGEVLFVSRRYAEAAARCRAAIDVAKGAAQKTYARLLLARAYGAAERPRERQQELEHVLESSPDLVDEHNVPLGLYAATALAPDGAPRKQLLNWVALALSNDRLFSRDAIGIAQSLAATLGASDAEARLTSLKGIMDRAEKLQHSLAMLGPPSSGDTVWVRHGDPMWLVTATPGVGNLDGLLVAVRADDVLQQLSAPGGGRIRLARAAEPAHELGARLPGLRVVIPMPGEPGSTSRPYFFAAGLLLAIAFAILAGAFLWRDVQRDLRLSEMRSQFVSSVSHELRTPLTAIRMFAETLKLDDDGDRVSRAEYLETIICESERLSRLVDNVLDFGRIERGQKSYRFEPVDLHEIVSKSARAAQYPLERAGFALDVVVEPGLPAIVADADALQQAVLNLLSNAMKYSGEARSIDLKVDRRDQYARIQVVDRGIGIAPHEQPRVFERFYRAVSAENHHIPGTGLGLTIVAHVASAHGGCIEVTSQPGRGSCFTLLLPLGRAGAPASALAAAG